MTAEMGCKNSIADGNCCGADGDEVYGSIVGRKMVLVVLIQWRAEVVAVKDNWVTMVNVDISDLATWHDRNV